MMRHLLAPIGMCTGLVQTDAEQGKLGLEVVLNLRERVLLGDGEESPSKFIG